MICCVMPAAGGGGAILIIMAALAVLEGAEWVLARIWWILGSGVIVAALTIAALVPLMRWAQRRDAARLPLWRAHEVPAQLYAQPVTELPRADRPAIAPVINLNFYGTPASERAAIIRTAIEGIEPQ